MPLAIRRSKIAIPTTDTLTHLASARRIPWGTVETNHVTVVYISHSSTNTATEV